MAGGGLFRTPYAGRSSVLEHTLPSSRRSSATASADSSTSFVCGNRVQHPNGPFDAGAPAAQMRKAVCRGAFATFQAQGRYLRINQVEGTLGLDKSPWVRLPALDGAPCLPLQPLDVQFPVEE
jgi:hypothetical protein